MIRLVLSDVDGTLIDSNKQLAQSSIDAVQQLREKGILFALTSGRPPKGLRMLFEPLTIDTPISAFNGGLIIDREFSPLKELTVDDDIVGPIINVLVEREMSVWLYQGTDWFVKDLQGPHVQHEAEVCAFQPSEVDSFDEIRNEIIKIVGVHDDPKVMKEATKAISEKFGHAVSATSSQTYYLDITHNDANKGSVVEYLANHFSISADDIVCIGDADNDTLMFKKAGLSIAMGNASDSVKSLATHSSTSNDDDGFANAIKRFILAT